MKEINVGIIGVGDIGKTHLYNCIRMQGVNVLAAADRSKKSRAVAKEAGVPKVYGDYRHVLDNPRISCVIIALPNFLHAESSIMAAENGKDILLEKPLARNVEEGRKITAAAERNNVKIMIGYVLNFSPLARLKAEIESGRLGDVFLASTYHMSYGPFYHRTLQTASVPIPVPSWWFDPEAVGGGVLLDLGSHMIDLLRLYFGSSIKAVRARLGYKFNMPFEDHATCFIEFEEGTLAVLNVSWCSLKPITKVELFGIADQLSMTFRPQFADLGSALLRLFRRERKTASSVYYDELRYFFSCIINDQEPKPSAKDGLKDLEIVSLAYKNRI